MSATFSSKLSGGNGPTDGTVQEGAGTVTSISFTGAGLTAVSGDTLLVSTVGIGGGSADPTSLAATWNAGSMTLGPVATNSTVHYASAIATLVNPTLGAKALAWSWTNAANVYMSGQFWQGTNTVTGINSGDSLTSTSSTTMTLTSTVDGATVASFIGDGPFPTMNFSYFWSEENQTPGGGGSYQVGNTSNAHTFTGGGTNFAIAGIHIIAGAVSNAMRVPLRFAGRMVGPTVARNRYKRNPIFISAKAPLTQQLASALTATLSFIGVLNTNTNTRLSGTLSFIGAFTKKVNTLLTSTLSFIGAQTKLANTHLTGTLSFIGALNKAITKGLTATLSFVGSLVKRTSKLLSGALSFIGNLTASHVTLVALTATLSFVGALIKRPATGLSGTLSFVGAIKKAVTTGLSATLSFAGALLKRTTKLLIGTLSFIGSFNASHLFIVALTATLSFAGSLASQFIAGTGAIVDYIVTFRRRRR